MSVLKSTLKMAIATFFSRILGLVREQVMAAYFGASGVTDAFLVAFRIPNLLRDLFAEGAFSSAFVPTFVEAKQQSEQESRELLWGLFILLGLTTGTVCLLIAIFAPELIEIFAPAFVSDPEKFHLTVTMTRIMAPFLTFVSWAALFMGALNSLKVFFLPSLAPAFFNIVSILVMLTMSGLLHESGMPSIYSLAIGAMLGGCAQAFVQLPVLYKYGFRIYWPKKIWTPKAVKIIKLIGPGLIGFAAAQINLLINTILATGAAVGATSWLNYSFRLFQLPVGILSVSIGNSNLVHFSESWKKGEQEEAKKLLEGSYYLSFLTVLPSLAILYFFSEEIVNLIFERGKFDHFSTLMTAEALRMYALGLPFYSLNKIWVPTFYALDRQKIPVIASLMSIGFNIIFSMTLTPIYGFKILALGTTLSMLVNSGFQSWVLKNDLKLAWNFFFSVRVIKVFLATTISALTVAYFFKVEFFSQPFMMKCLIMAFQITAVGVIYIGLLYIMGERSAVKALLGKLTKKFLRK